METISVKSPEISKKISKIAQKKQEHAKLLREGKINEAIQQAKQY